jgi:hypothetical protein
MPVQLLGVIRPANSAPVSSPPAPLPRCRDGLSDAASAPLFTFLQDKARQSADRQPWSWEQDYPWFTAARFLLMLTPPHSPIAPAALPPLIAAYVEATNSFDLERLLATFADDALVNDQLRDYWGKAAIREWAERDIIGERLTMVITTIIEHYGNFIVSANVDGNFDKRGLPDPLVLAFYFTPHDDRIVQLIILRNRFDV